MCTALSFKTSDHYFGRNLDIDCSYGEEICIMPRNFPFTFRKEKTLDAHHAIIGMGSVVNGTPLYYDGVNEYGLCAAGLNFPENACYRSAKDGMSNIAPFELIPWVLSQCKTAAEVKGLLSNVNITDELFGESLPSAPLHWIICDRDICIVAEPMNDRLFVYDNPARVLTNNPPLKYQLENLENYRHLRINNANAKKDTSLPYSAYSQGLGAVGLPGDVSSMSRFVRTVFLLENSVCAPDEDCSLSQVFHILDSVKMTRGACQTDAGTWDATVYSACINATRGRYYYTTYDNRQISCVDMYKTDLNSSALSRFPLMTKQSIMYQN